MLIYADTSALIKIVIREPESAALEAFLHEIDVLVTSRITQVELVRSTQRQLAAKPSVIDEILGQLVFREVTRDIAASAGLLEPTQLLSLDAIHLASAIEMRNELDAFLTYDTRLAEAARQNGLTVAMPTA